MNIPVCLPGDELGHGSAVEVVQASLDELRKHSAIQRPIPVLWDLGEVILEGSSAASEEEFM